MRRTPVDCGGAFAVLLLTAACPAPEPADVARDAAPIAVAEAPAPTPAEIRARGNRLVGEPSPYLQQHAHNPVDWWPWGAAALAEAKRRNVPIFLSIGYSTCHWCHVMERESFEDDEVAALLNEGFVAIKVDREQRPDVDAVYIAAVAALGGSTGWPLSVFLTPDGAPFFGGTYWPKTSQQGRPGFVDVLAEVRRTWAEDGERAAGRGRDVLAAIERRASEGAGAPLDPEILDAAMAALAAARDTVHGGFGRRQKFPNAPVLLAELRYWARAQDTAARDHVVLTLERMAEGGLRDHVAGTFHRYTVDGRWHLPHFEKTLYDNAQLASLYVEAGLRLGREDFVATGRAILDDLIATWRTPSGAFVVGFDADDPAGEGAYYSWTAAEVRELLGERDGEIVVRAFALDQPGEEELEGRSVLHRQHDDEVARALGLPVGRVREAVAAALPRLADARRRRPAPAIDDKAIVSWNALAVIALADAGRRLGEPRYVEAAVAAADAIDRACRRGDALARGVRGEVALGPGFLEDYALSGLAALRLHAATGDESRLVGARTLARAIEARFHDAEQHTFRRSSSEHADVPLHLVDMEDNVSPSGGAAAALLMLELGALAGDERLHEIGRAALARVADRAKAEPMSAGFVLVGIDHATASVREVVIAGAPGDAATAALRAVLHESDGARIVGALVGAEGPSAAASAAFPALEGKRAIAGKPTAYVCERGKCRAPTGDPSRLRSQIRDANP
jgi:uncharacterized protein YyaL (SSP411 family)